ncbi:MAG TPA: GNAT family N-acetyltransferase [Gemmatimonadaceae bacterium]|nr:GNAT family N-acetyltransferase [Gemmatimonadaceae bacterium]
MPDIRPAQASDARPLALLAEQTFRGTLEGMNTPEDMQLHCETHYSAALQLREILDPALETLVCERDGQLVGFAQLRWGPSPECVGAQQSVEIQRFYVSQAWQGRGVAQALMATAIALAETHGADQIWLGVWERNPRAIAFYKKCGFAEVGEHTFLLGTDPQRDLVMRRPIRRYEQQG